MLFDQRPPLRSMVAYITVGSVWSFIPLASRLWKTQEIRARSSARPVSFSMMEARTTACPSSSVTPALRLDWAFSHALR
jgi:hypothetical protein